MGWNTVTKRADAPILTDTPENSYFYFVHSYYVRPADPSIIALECDYGGKFCAMVRQNNLFATQFHPEKSQTNGLQVLKAFEQINQHGETANSESSST
jgi:glutamine amidotransferase